MYLKRLELTGFKSFAQRTILEFPKPPAPVQSDEEKKQNEQFNLTAIVGPNGSGKSNCAESIRWALGEQSIKALRGKKALDIIFSGSKEKMRLNLAEVVLFFNNENGVCPIDYKEFTITRRTYRNGESEYLINKSRVKLQDILILLAKANFGQKSYSIIGQGTIDQILISSPLERKKFFDEATGIKQYQIKKDIALRKIEKSRENLHQAETALSEIIPRLRSLGRQINKLARRKQIEAELRDLQKKYYGTIWRDLKEKIFLLGKNLSAETEKQRDIKKELDAYLKESRALVYEETDKSYQKIQQEYQEITKIKNEYLSRQSIIKAQLIFEQEKIKQNKQKPEISVDQKKIFDNLKNLQARQQEFISQVNKTSKINELNTIKLLAENILNKINLILDFFQPRVATENKNHREITDSTEKGIKEIKIQEKKLEQKIKKLDQKLDQINDQISQFSQKEREKRKKLFEWQNKIQKKQSHLNQINESINEIKINAAKLETKKEDLEQEIKNQIQNQITENLDDWLSGAQNERATKESESVEFEDIQKLKHQLELIGGIDPEIEKEYPEVKGRYEFLSTQSADLKKSLKSLNKIIEELNLKIKNQFKEKFFRINQEFDRYFKTIFNGGKAKITFQPSAGTQAEDDSRANDEEKQLENLSASEKTQVDGGIDILATPPGKKIKSIEMLSGGEKALTALALICAIISINRPPFVVLDEVDAALDQENSARFTEILKELRKHTQFIIITHNQQTIEVADVLYGVSMGRDGISRIISLKLENDN